MVRLRAEAETRSSSCKDFQKLACDIPHGCKASNLPSILREGSLPMPGDKLMDGTEPGDKLMDGTEWRKREYAETPSNTNRLRRTSVR
jgi:hypothetical protein